MSVVPLPSPQPKVIRTAKGHLAWFRFADLNQHGSHLRPTAQCESKVVDALDDLSWLNQFGSMHAVNYDPSNEILSDEHPVHVEVEL
ncbi:hypothetical protein AB1Y20_017966 [Prymnesium parvum]|uniref:Uncharacterized protein n=1 Tax=Prymnesium parvum TaxID=97485 RepID=A0AB34JPK7_PRYPA